MTKKMKITPKKLEVKKEAQIPDYDPLGNQMFDTF